MKNIVISLLCLLFFPLTVSARVDRTISETDKLKVLCIDPSNSRVTVDGKKVSENDIILASSALSCKTNAKYIKILNLRTNVAHCYCLKDLNLLKSIFNSYVKRNRASSKGAGIDANAIADMKRVFENRFYMMEDEIFINSSLPNDKTHYFELCVFSDGKQIFIPLLQNPEEPYTIYIPKSHLLKYGVNVETAPVRFAVTYITPDKEIPLTNYFYIEYIK